jgi:hypothetical protein
MTLSPKIPSILIMPFLDSFIIMCLSIDHAYFKVKVRLIVFILVDLGKTEGSLVNPNLLTIIYYINEGESKNILTMVLCMF